MLDHVSMALRDIAVAAPFRDAVMKALEVPCVWREALAIDYGPRNGPGDDGHSTLTLREGLPAGDPAIHWCLRAPSRRAVRAFHAAGLAHGGADDGPPGLRLHYHTAHYAAFLREPDGNRREAVTHRAQP